MDERARKIHEKELRRHAVRKAQYAVKRGKYRAGKCCRKAAP